MGTEHEALDVDYWHGKADSWSEANGEKKKNWGAAIRNWIITAKREGKHWATVYETAAIAKNLAGTMTNWQKEPETAPQIAQEAQQAVQMEIPHDWTEFWEGCQESAKKGQDCIIPVPIYDWLEKTRRLTLTKDEKIDAFFEAKFAYMKKLEESFMPQDRKTLIIMRSEGWGNNRELYDRVVKLAKVLSAKKYLYESIRK